MRKRDLLALVAGVILLGGASASQDRSSVSGASAAISAKPSEKAGFLTKADKPQKFTPSRVPEIERQCTAAATSGSRAKCPSTLTSDGAAHGGAQPSPVIAAGLPHLRMYVILRRLENKVISGGGVKTADQFNPTFAYWTLTSAAATSTENMAYPVGLPTPEPGNAWDNLDHANLLFAGIIQNGCSKATKFDVSLESSIGDLQGATFGDVSLSDETIGYGYYTFQYKIRATGSDDGVSDFLFSGEVPVTCVGQASF